MRNIYLISMLEDYSSEILKAATNCQRLEFIHDLLKPRECSCRGKILVKCLKKVLAAIIFLCLKKMEKNPTRSGEQGFLNYV